MHLAHDPGTPAAPTIDFNQFLAVDIRVGTILAAEPFPQPTGVSWIKESVK